MDGVKWEARIVDDRLHLSVSRNGSIVTTVADAGEVEALIEMLASRRKAMAPEVPREIPGDQPVGEVDPVWAVLLPAEAPDKTVAIRHSGIGWLWFHFPEATARQLADGLRTSAPSHPTPQ